jgi:hypothetical protein
MKKTIARLLRLIALWLDREGAPEYLLELANKEVDKWRYEVEATAERIAKEWQRRLVAETAVLKSALDALSVDLDNRVAAAWGKFEDQRVRYEKEIGRFRQLVDDQAKDFEKKQVELLNRLNSNFTSEIKVFEERLKKAQELSQSFAVQRNDLAVQLEQSKNLYSAMLNDTEERLEGERMKMRMELDEQRRQIEGFLRAQGLSTLIRHLPRK